MTTTTEDMKRQAKRIARATTITHAQALDVLAVQNGYTHWGAMLKARTFGAGQDAQGPVRVLLEPIHSEPLPQIGGCRHLLISGGTASGKMTLVNRIVAGLGDRSVCIIQEDGRIVAPVGATDRRLSRTDDPFGYPQTITEAIREDPDVLVIGEISTLNAGAVLEAMERCSGPMVISTVHASRVEEIDMTVRARASAWGAPVRGLPKHVAIIQLEVQSTGRRAISSIVASG